MRRAVPQGPLLVNVVIEMETQSTFAVGSATWHYSIEPNTQIVVTSLFHPSGRQR